MKRNVSALLWMAGIAALGPACGSKQTSQPAPPSAPTERAPTAPVATPAAPAKPVVDLAGMDRSIAPGDDFYGFANEGWLKANEIPPDRSSFGPWQVVAELTSKRIAELIAEAAKDAAAGTDARKVGDFYAAFLDEATISTKGLAPVQPTLDRIAKIADAKALAAALGGMLRADVDVLNATALETPNLFGLWVAQDLSDPSKYSPFLLQGGLGLPDRDYYLDAAPRMAELRAQYLVYVTTLLKLANIKDADAKAKRVVALERKIAEVHAPRSETADVQKGNNHWTRADLAKRAPGLDWQAFLGAAGLAEQPGFVVWQPRGVIGISKLVRSEALAVWKDYLTARVLAQAAPMLPKAFDDATFALYGKALAGAQQQRDRWKRAVDATNDALGEAVGRLYVAKYFPPSEKARVEEMVKNELAAFARRIDALTWMTPATKAKAKAKLAALKVGVGYPDKWRDYSKLEVVAGDAYGNFVRAELDTYQRALAKLGKPVDRSEWVMNPQLINAVNLPAMNAMNFPAAILQPPWLDPNRPRVMDYAAAGSVIGHEISHSFDDQGAQFDETGKLANWWTPEDLAHFEAAAKQLIAQYDAYRPFPDLAVNGKLTVSENIADVAGLSVAYDAYRASYGGKEAPTVDGLTGDQQFFLAFAQSWRRKDREPALRRQVLTNGHAPAQYRGATVRNLDAWYDAFQVKPEQKLFLAPSARVRVW